MVTGEGFPAKCTRMNAEGQLPDCIQHSDGTWEAVYPTAGAGGGGFAVLFVLVLVLGVAGTVWKVSTARRMARDAGMDTGDATAMTLLTDEGFEATYLASNLRGQAAPAPSAPARGPAAERLAELQALRDQGLVTDAEHAAARQRILDEL
jgi:hypothetical protein